MALRWFTGKGEKGDKGDQGIQGVPGNDGYSPEASVMQTATGATVTIKDKNGITSATLTNGQNGAKGDDGVSPSATVTPTANGATIAITDKNGTTTANITNGTDGEKGDAGVSPTATVTPNANGAEIAITDVNGTTTAQINNGSAGTNGVDGVSPTASVTPTANGATISITDKNGTTTANITNGTDGQKGDDGVSPQASVQQTANGATITITDAGGTTSASITNGQNGQDGAPGPAGVGIPSGGSDGQVLVKDGVTDYVAKWADPQGGGLEVLYDSSVDGNTVAEFVNKLKSNNGMVLIVSGAQVYLSDKVLTNRIKLRNGTITVDEYDNSGSAGYTYIPSGFAMCGSGYLDIFGATYGAYKVSFKKIIFNSNNSMYFSDMYSIPYTGRYPLSNDETSLYLASPEYASSTIAGTTKFNGSLKVYKVT